MKNTKKIGIWMDHSVAHLMDFASVQDRSLIASEFTFTDQLAALSKSESLMHNKRQQMHEAFYKKISAEILKYDHVLLFGPSNAKTELHNYLNKDIHFKDVKIDIEAADNMTDKEQSAYVRQHFENQ